MRTLKSNIVSDNHKVSLWLVQQMYSQFKESIPKDLQQFWDDSYAYFYQTTPEGNTTEKWVKSIYGNRYGYHNSATGLLSEFITISILQEQSSDINIIMCSSKQHQLTDKIDLIDTVSEQSYQIKSIRILNNMVTLEHDIVTPDYIVAVDIDSNNIFMIPTLNYSDIIEDHPDTRPHGANGIKHGWKFNAEILYELNELDTHCTTHLYTKPPIPLTVPKEISILF